MDPPESPNAAELKQPPRRRTSNAARQAKAEEKKLQDERKAIRKREEEEARKEKARRERTTQQSKKKHNVEEEDKDDSKRRDSRGSPMKTGEPKSKVGKGDNVSTGSISVDMSLTSAVKKTPASGTRPASILKSNSSKKTPHSTGIQTTYQIFRICPY